MYNYNFLDDEHILFESISLMVEYDDKKEKLALIITDKNFILLQDINKNSIINITRKGYEVPKYVPVLNISKADINYSYNGTSTKIILNNKIIYIYDVDLRNYLK